MSVRPLATAAIVIASCAAGGCGDPCARAPEPKPEIAGRRAGSAEAPPLSASVSARGFARRWINWDSHSLAAQQRGLAHLATGALAAELEADARRAVRPAVRLASRGVVAAVKVKAVGARATGLVVTREQSYTDGRADLGGRRYRVYLVGLLAGNHRWSVSRWAPQP